MILSSFEYVIFLAVGMIVRSCLRDFSLESGLYQLHILYETEHSLRRR